MGIVDTIKTAAEEFVKPVDETSQTPVAPEVPTEPEVEPTQEAASIVDRSAYNCPVCGGEGLVADTFEEGGLVRCPQCQGTGKV